MKKELVEITYSCKCGHQQVVRYFPDDTTLPATCCVECRAGFNSELSYEVMASRGIGMLPGKPVHV